MGERAACARAVARAGTSDAGREGARARRVRAFLSSSFKKKKMMPVIMPEFASCHDVILGRWPWCLLGRGALVCRSLSSGATGRHAALGGRESAACGKDSEPRVGGKGRHSNGTERNLVD